MHAVTLVEVVGRASIEVDSFHREAIAVVGPGVRGVAHAPGGVIEISEHPFAIGLQWRQELLVHEEHPGDAVFKGLLA